MMVHKNTSQGLVPRDGNKCTLSSDMDSACAWLVWEALTAPALSH